jgi:hypothetical protein
MAVQNVIGDSFRGATWVSLHNGAEWGWGEAINGGFGMYIDGTKDTARRIRMMLNWDVSNGIARRSWARNEGAMFTLKREMERTPGLNVTVPYIADDEIIENVFKMVEEKNKLKPAVSEHNKHTIFHDFNTIIPCKAGKFRVDCSGIEYYTSGVQ